MNIIYLRVSKEDEAKQDPEQQLTEIIHKFKLKEYKVFEERGSAYDLNKIHKRKEFLKILNECFDAEKVTISDIFLNKIDKKSIHIYVWDYSRIIRNIELSLLFQLLANWNNVKIHSYKDNQILKEHGNETPTGKLTIIVMNTISAFSGEEYSYTISTNVKKAFTKEKNSTYSKKGNKIGKKFVDSMGNNLNFSARKENKMYEYIVSLILDFEERKVGCYYPLIIEQVKNKFGPVVSSAYLSKIKKGVIDNGNA